jgi:hypothetical protein
VLPIGGPQDMLLNRLVAHPELIANKRVFDPFAGSGVLGLMALQLGAAQVDFLDINPRAQQFQLDNARRNGFAAERFNAQLGSIVDCAGAGRYDVVLANPPFVPTPTGIAGTLTSAAGSDGNELLEILIAKLDGLLEDAAEASIFVMQLVAEGRPLIADAAVSNLPGRTIAFTPVQLETMPLQTYVAANLRCFPHQAAKVEAWADALRAQHGADVGIQHYLIHVQPKRPGPARWIITDDLAEKYGENFAYTAAAFDDLALGRALENVVPPPP